MITGSATFAVDALVHVNDGISFTRCPNGQTARKASSSLRHRAPSCAAAIEIATTASGTPTAWHYSRNAPCRLAHWSRVQLPRVRRLLSPVPDKLPHGFCALMGQILPLTARKTTPPSHVGPLTRHGAVFHVKRQGGDFYAKWISAVGVYPCEGGRDERSEAALDAALQAGGWENVTRLYRTDDIPTEKCWLRTSGWALAYA